MTQHHPACHFYDNPSGSCNCGARRDTVSGLPGVEEAPQLKMHGPYDKELGIFNAMMRYKMENNRHRGRWQDCTLADALAGLKREVEELEAVVRSGNVVDILLESADVGNFAMIAAFVAMEVKNG